MCTNRRHTMIGKPTSMLYLKAQMEPGGGPESDFQAVEMNDIMKAENINFNTDIVNNNGDENNEGINNVDDDINSTQCKCN